MPNEVGDSTSDVDTGGDSVRNKTITQWHEVYKVTLCNGETYCVDPTGAQYGFEDRVISWQAFMSDQAWFIYDCKPLGWHANELPARKPLPNNYPDQIASMSWREKEEMAEAFDDHLKGLIMRHIPVSKLLELPETAYLQESRMLLLDVRHAYRKSVRSVVPAVNAIRASVRRHLTETSSSGQKLTMEQSPVRSVHYDVGGRPFCVVGDDGDVLLAIDEFQTELYRQMERLMRI